MIDWKKYFDRVFVLHYAGYTEIEDRLMSELARVGLTNSGILTIHDNISSPMLQMLSRNVDKDPSNMRDSSFSCSFGHYSIMKIAELKGYDRILILEDDIVFHKDVSVIQQVFEHVTAEQPNYDVCLFSHFQSPCCECQDHIPTYINEMQNAAKNDKYAITFNSRSAAVASGAAYGLSKRGIIALRGLYEHQVQIADMIFRDIPYHVNGHVDNFHAYVLGGLQRFYCRVPICLQNNVKKSVTGDILGNNFIAIMNAQRKIAEAAGIFYDAYNFK